MRRLIPALLLLVVMTGCSDDEATTSASTRSGPSSASSPSASGTPDTCRRTHRLTLTSRQPRVLYALRLAVAPGARGTGSQDATLYTYPALSAGVYVDQPVGARLDPRTRDVLLAEVPQGSPLLDGVRGLSWDVRNDQPSRGRYLVYAGATVYSAQWSARPCDGSARRLKGTVVVVGRIREGLERCGEARPADRLRRVALVTACHHDPIGYRQFRDPTG